MSNRSTTNRRLHQNKFSRAPRGSNNTEPANKTCTWLREVSSCSWLVFLPDPAWLLPIKICGPCTTGVTLSVLQCSMELVRHEFYSFVSPSFFRSISIFISRGRERNGIDIGNETAVLIANGSGTRNFTSLGRRFIANTSCLADPRLSLVSG